jgi:hypothetical protein
VRLDVRTGQLGIPIRVQQALFGHERGTLPVHMDGAAFIDDWRAVTIQALDLEHLLGHGVILAPWKVQPAVQSAPGIEAPVDSTPLSLAVGDDGRPHVAHPRVVMRHLDHTDRRGQQVAGEFEMRGGYTHADGLEACDGRRHVGKRLLRRLRARAPVVRAFRPQHPAASMRSEFGGHGIAVGERRGLHCFRHDGGIVAMRASPGPRPGTA